MGERATGGFQTGETDGVRVSRKDEGGWLTRGTAQRGVCLHLAGPCEDACRAGAQERRGFLGGGRDGSLHVAEGPGPGLEAAATSPDLSQPSSCRTGGSSGWGTGLPPWGALGILGTAVPMEGSSVPPGGAVAAHLWLLPFPESPTWTGSSCGLTFHPGLAQCQGPHFSGVFEGGGPSPSPPGQLFGCIKQQGSGVLPLFPLPRPHPARGSETRPGPQICGPRGVRRPRPHFPLATRRPQLDAPAPEAGSGVSSEKTRERAEKHQGRPDSRARELEAKSHTVGAKAGPLPRVVSPSDGLSSPTAKWGREGGGTGSCGLGRCQVCGNRETLLPRREGGARRFSVSTQGSD